MRQVKAYNATDIKATLSLHNVTRLWLTPTITIELERQGQSYRVKLRQEGYSPDDWGQHHSGVRVHRHADNKQQAVEKAQIIIAEIIQEALMGRSKGIQGASDAYKPMPWD